MYCNNCGKYNAEDSVFCEHCGIRFEDLNRLDTKKEDKSRNSNPLFRKKTLGIIILFIFAGLLLYSYLSNPQTNNNNQNGKDISSSSNSHNQAQAPQDSNDNLQSVIDISCDNGNGGSGTIFTEDGIVQTNNHVIDGASSCLITLPDKTTGEPNSIYKANPLIIPGLSKEYDIAFLQINNAYTDNNGKKWGKYPTTFHAFISPKACSNYTPKLGEPIKIYGYPVTSGGYNLTITDGIISSFADNQDILTSAKVDSGNSGGLAVNNNGCYLGIPSAVVSGNYQNLGVIIPSSIINEFINKITSLTPFVNDTQINRTQSFDLSCLKLKNEKMLNNSYYNSNPTYSASIYNGCSNKVKSVGLQINFYKANADINALPIDTEYIDSGLTDLASSKSYLINGTINTPVDTSGDFTWTSKIYRADSK